MRSDLSPQRELDLLERLADLAEQRRRRQSSIQAEFEAAVEECEREQQESWERLRKHYGVDLAAAQETYDRELNEIQTAFERDHSNAEFEYALAQERLQSMYNDAMQAAASARDCNRRAAEAKYSEETADAETRRKKDRKALASFRADVQQTQTDAEQWLRNCRLGRIVDQYEDAPDRKPPSIADVDGKLLRKWRETLQEDLQKLASLRLPALFQGNRFLGAVISIWITSIFPVVLLLVYLGMAATPAALVGTFGVALLCAVVGGATARTLYGKAQRQAGHVYQTLREHLADAQVVADEFEKQADQRLKHRRALADRQRREQLEAVGHEYLQAHTQASENLTREQCLLNDRFARRQALLCQERDIRLRQTVVRRQPGLRELRAAFQQKAEEHRAVFSRRIEQLRTEHQRSTEAQDLHWRSLSEQARDEVRELQLLSEQAFPAPSSEIWDQWAGAATVPAAIRVGRLRVDAERLLQGLQVEQPWQGDGDKSIWLPALMKFPDSGSLIVKGAGAAKQAANDLLCAVMFHYLTAFPPGKVRFTILDPVGLGKDFAPFMHLADYNDQLVTNRIWTESQHIHQRLVDLTEHMENVLQTYLRSEFSDIEQYNASAGEVAEPYRILVVANFPANFNETTAERLLSILSSGPRCGVYTLLSLDADREMPLGFPLSDLESQCQVLQWEDGRFRMLGPFADHELTVEKAPPAEFIGRIVHVVGRRAKEASKVEVPFSKVAVPEEEWWEANTDDGIEIAMGPAGARKLQHLQLGQGTSQHVLMAGKTGSGKSTLLHVLITNLALRYSPDQLELYLIDFKKGVEFKRYAARRLPHARVVAIESEREFGLSVMQRLDAEMQRRGQLFRELGVQGLKGYRRQRPGDPMPRILLLVDEFQELFIEEDKLAQDASLLLDRLVRQGRAFGIHVLLGSQTLAGEYTLPRSTIGQMGVRIALQCSEADAHLILSDDNMAARLLSRPGEAIYNDANGLVEGNHPFQVAWLSDEDSDRQLDAIADLARRRLLTEPSMIVFEGNRPADLAANSLLNDLIAAEDWPKAQRAFPVWLGDPVAIQAPSSVTFRREGGKNLLLIGQNPDAGLALLAAAVVSLALQHPADDVRNATVGARFYLFDGSPVDDPSHGVLRRAFEHIPHRVITGGFRELPECLEEMAVELERRIAENDLAAPSIYLMLYDLQRFREIRKSEDEFGFSSAYDDSSSDSLQPEKRIATILKDGPAFGIHTLVWCDGWNNLNRTFDRASMSEFEMRVLFQMSSGDSSLLIDSPAASKLGSFRAFSYTQAQDTLEKFRPYGLPDEQWLAEATRRLRQRQDRAPTA